MPISIIVGGQFGSEGKGKVSHHFAKELNATCAVRCGGSNSGHTVVDESGKKIILQHLPTPSILKNVKSFLAAGSYINLEILLSEIKQLNIKDENLFIDENAVIVDSSDMKNEASNENLKQVSSTMSGTGSAVISRIQRNSSVRFAKDVPELKHYICNVSEKLRTHLANNERIIIEGTQGFGLSVLHSPYYPYVTSRDTTAAGFLSECGLSPLDVDDIIMVLRLFPIRVSGSSGPLENETSWDEIAEKGCHTDDIREYTSVTKKLRRVAYFDAEIVKKAITVNMPTRIVLNHLDLFHSDIILKKKELEQCLLEIEKSINCSIKYLGFGAESVIPSEEM